MVKVKYQQTSKEREKREREGDKFGKIIIKE